MADYDRELSEVQQYLLDRRPNMNFAVERAECLAAACFFFEKWGGIPGLDTRSLCDIYYERKEEAQVLSAQYGVILERLNAASDAEDRLEPNVSAATKAYHDAQMMVVETVRDAAPP